MTTLNEFLAAGLMTELDYLPADEQAESLEREAFLMSCEADELSDAAEFIALVVSQ
jgi:hypothetical protein